MKNHELQKWAFGQSLESVIRSQIGAMNTSPDNFKQAVTDLPASERRQLRRVLIRYSKAQARNISKIQEGLTYSFFSGVRHFFGIFARGAAAGISVAGVVNTIAPGLFNTLCGYLAGSANGKIVLKSLGRLGLVSLGAFTPVAVSQYAILALGAVLGIVLYALFILFRIIFRTLTR